MNRRDFMGTVVAGAVATQLASAGGEATAEVPASLPRARWLASGLIDAGGTHEPSTFVVRRGGQRLDARQEYERVCAEACSWQSPLMCRMLQFFLEQGFDDLLRDEARGSQCGGLTPQAGHLQFHFIGRLFQSALLNHPF